MYLAVLTGHGDVFQCDGGVFAASDRRNGSGEFEILAFVFAAANDKDCLTRLYVTEVDTHIVVGAKSVLQWVGLCQRDCSVVENVENRPTC
jgi:hypothetical protein